MEPEAKDTGEVFGAWPSLPLTRWWLPPQASAWFKRFWGLCGFGVYVGFLRESWGSGGLGLRTSIVACYVTRKQMKSEMETAD